MNKPKTRLRLTERGEKVIYGGLGGIAFIAIMFLAGTMEMNL